MSALRLAASVATLLCAVAGGVRAAEPVPADAPIPTVEPSPIEDGRIEDGRIEDGRLLAFRSPRVKAVEVESPKVDFFRSTLGGMLVMMRETYVVTFETEQGQTGKLLLMVNATANTERPFEDESEAAVRKDVVKAAKYHPIYADAVRIDGAWFTTTGYGPKSGDEWSSANYFGRRHGISYMLMASYLAERTPVADMRAVMESVALLETPMRGDVAIYRDFLARAVSLSGLASHFGPVPVPGGKRFTLDSMTPIPRPDGDGGGAGYHRVEYERVGNGWLSVLCLPDGGLGRDRLEQMLLSGDSISDVRAEPPLDTPAGQIRRSLFQRRVLQGGRVQGRAWTAYRDGTLFEITTDGDPTGGDVDAIVAALSDPARTCVPIPPPPSSAPAASPAAP